MAKQQKPDYSEYVKKFWKYYWYTFGGVILLFILASFGLFGHMPDFEELENPNSNVASEIISSDGVTIGKYYQQNRTPVKYEDLPENLVKALVATEDERFYEHSGIDGKRTLGAAVKLGTDGGASTITQQLAKNLFHREGSRFLPFRLIQKVKEWIIAIKLERQYSKQEIIAMYFNTVDFVNNAVGIRSASKIYFNKEPKDLTTDECALFVGMLKNPSLYNPKNKTEKRKKLVLDRRNTVLGQMLKKGIISEAEKRKLEKLPVKLDFTPEDHNLGIATYFREYLRSYLKKWAKEHPKDDGTEYDVYKDGLKIYVTIDSRMQEYAEDAVTQHIKNLQKEFFKANKDNKNAPFTNITPEETEKIIRRAMKNSERWRIMKDNEKTDAEIIASFNKKAKMKIFSWKGEIDTLMTPRDSIIYYKHFLQAGLMSMEPQTGYVKAWVGGIDSKYFQYDHVGQGARQVGSTFKPFLYATAIEQAGMSPCDTIIDSPYTIPQGKWGVAKSWTPKNSDGRYRGMVNLKQALANSINTVSAKLIDRVGPKNVADMTRKLGVTSEVPENPSIALGAIEITVMDMVAAYSTFANEGIYVEPQIITRIEDKNGVVIYEAEPETREVVNKDVAYAMIKLMEGVTESGTGSRLRYGSAGFMSYNYNFSNPIAGKTGTSQNNSDGWFMGMVPNLTTGIWVGNEDRAAHFRSTAMGQGATMALPIWGIYMYKCYNDKTLDISKDPFERPKDLAIKVDCYTARRVKDTTQTDSLDVDVDEFDF